MRVLYLNADPGVPVFGPKGASVHVRSMATALSRLGHEVRVLASRQGGPPGPETPFVVLPELGAPPPGLAPEQAERHTLEHRDETTERVRRLVHHLRPDLVYERHSLWCEAGVIVARQAGIPHLLEVNAPLIDESLRFRTLGHPTEAEATARHVFAGTSTALVVSRPAGDYVRRLGGCRVRLFPNAVDGSLFQPEPAKRFGGEGPVLGFCGGLRPWHGAEALADVLAHVRRALPAATLLVVGDGPGRAALEHRAAELGVQAAIRFAGAVEHEEVPRWLARMDVALAPHPRLEPFWFSPLKILEAQAAGLPVLATRQGDLPLLVEHGRTGILVEPGDVIGMARWAVTLHHDRSLAASIGAAARLHVLMHHTWERRVAELEMLAAGAAGNAVEA